ncbi:MAG: glycerol-3-phosphate dehydrogenase/oxidase [Kiritimatiellae bacterium]|nr:glycerol-3-phosphate dehydrogenase/oxidase [Kiritimatiellia bacterium]MDD4340731.1 glycerol-3-phosphate dehydrogenase/oxidase [Kiritimatiellia bacterium]
MQRNLSALSAAPFDLLIVGGGSYGAAVAREAATRGLKTALVEQADFCSGSSANSLKIIHGGLRYLQQADLPRVFESIRERSILLQTAPHLVAPVSCLMPTRGLTMKSRPVMALGMLANDILSSHRNRHLDPLRHIPNGGTLSRREMLGILPMLRDTRTTGAARWYDGLAYDTERLVLGMVKAAARAGAVVANHARVCALRQDQNRITGAVVEDGLSGATFDVRAAMVVNAAGPWIGQMLEGLERPLAEPAPHLALGMNLLLRNWPITSDALALQSTRQNRLYFFMPWRGTVMAGTYYREHTGSPDDLKVTDDDIHAYIEDLNSSLPGAAITRDDIVAVHAGIVPCRKPARPDQEPALLRHYRLIDHARRDGIQGLFSICGIKYTTARGVAEHVVTTIAKRIGVAATPSTTRHDLLPGGDIPDLAAFQQEMATAHPAVAPNDLDHLMALYGTEAQDILALANTLEGPDALLRAEVLFAVRDEMPLTLGDLLFRRISRASTGRPEPALLRICAETMGQELSWDEAQIQQEITAVENAPTLWQAASQIHL